MDNGTPSALPEKVYDAIIGAYDSAVDVAKVKSRQMCETARSA